MIPSESLTLHIYPVTDTGWQSDMVDLRYVDSWHTVHLSERSKRDDIMSVLFEHDMRFRFYDVVIHTFPLVRV